MSGVSFASGFWFIICRVCRIRWSEIMLRKGDCSNCMESPCRSVPLYYGLGAAYARLKEQETALDYLGKAVAKV